MKILHIDLERGWRGGQQQVAYLMKYLAELGCTPLLAARPGQPLAQRAAEAGWNTVPVNSWFSGARRVARFVREESVSIVHTHSSGSQNLGLLLKLLCPGVALVVSRRVDFHRRPGILNAWKYRTGLVGRWAAISENVKGVLIADGVPEERIAVIASGIEPARIQQARPTPQERERLRAEFGVGAEDFLVGSVGALVPHKDRATLIRGAAHAAEAGLALHLIIAGEGTERPHLEALIAEAGLERQIHLLGHREDVPRLLHLFDLFALSSREEGLGTSVLDAMAAGLPIVVTDAGGLPEMIAHGRNGLIVPAADPKALGQAFANMAHDRAFMNSAGEANREDVNRFSARATAEQTLELYRSLVGGGN